MCGVCCYTVWLFVGVCLFCGVLVWCLVLVRQFSWLYSLAYCFTALLYGLLRMALQYPDTSMGIHTCLVILYNSGGVYQDVQFIYSLSLYYGTQYARQIFAILERERKREKKEKKR